jgi:hypothetical protein
VPRPFAYSERHVGEPSVRPRRGRVAWGRWGRAGVGVALIALAYMLSQRLWVDTLTPPEALPSAMRWPLRLYFSTAVAMTAVVTPLVFRWARRWNALFLMRLGLLLTIVGALGLWVVLPLISTATGAGGIVFDPGHTLSESAPTGSLWLYLCLVGWMPYLAGFREYGDEGRIEQIALALTLVVPLYIILYLVVLTGFTVTAP